MRLIGIAVAALLLTTASVHGQEDLNVLPEGRGREMLGTYLRGQAKKAFDARRAAVAALKTPEDVLRRQEELRGKFIEAIGGFPERTPLNARTVGRLSFEKYDIEKVIYESRPNHHVTAALYLPKGTERPYPGVIVPCGHGDPAKASDYNQMACAILASNGIAAMCYDPIGQGERKQLINADNRATIAGSTTEHTMVSVGGILVGRSTASYRIWDGIRSIDYLASREDVDAKRIGCTGVSGGGTLTSYLMALDGRIKAAAPSCYITSLERLFETIGPQDGEQNITGQVAFGMEHSDYVTMRAPAPTLVLCATKDFFDITGTWTSFREAKNVYALTGFGERVDLVEINAGHGFPTAHREPMVRFMRRWLLGKDDAATEGKYPVLKVEELSCTSSGQVMREFAVTEKSVFDLNREEAERLRALRSAKPMSPEGLRNGVRTALGLSDQKAAARTEPAGEVRREGYTVRKFVVTPDDGIALPTLVFSPHDRDEALPTVLYVHGHSKAVDAAAGGPIEKLVRAGHTVVAPDLRGLGETTRSPVPFDRVGYFGLNYHETFISLHLSRPLLGQRVADVLAILDQLPALGAASKEVQVIGVGAAGPVVLHAAALDPRFGRVTLERSVESFESIVRTPVSVNHLATAVPGALRTYDLPDLVGLIGPQRVAVRNPVDPAGKAVEETR